ncbi:putative inactive tRNA-specific adenosine deaminase-like protein 3 [Dorcoceras hygrometricum]|uniref:Putative inactive tRNA-specific adenosine deaminase-like protein 3 n=1 Tax=Dorcoceras hygrometricum TaxID=472368 RepID=A0A2Z7A6P1_9LAMI|nr:putative inactive tRNA-specific adenosine deaminase-like protein 3 [Dorcoceras hygrometricum]
MNGIRDETPTDLLRSWKIVHIPDKPPVSPHLQETVSMLAASIEPKCANLVVRHAALPPVKLNQTAPLENLRHVKRIRRTSLDGGKTQLSVILCIASGDGESNNLPKDVLELVCKYAALTKEEWEEQCRLWPTSFHPPAYNIDGITGFSEEDSLLVYNFMKIAVALAKSGIGVVNAAVIVDPSTCQVIASARDQVQSRNVALNFTSEETSTAEQLEAATMDETTEIKNDQSFLVGCSADESKLPYHGVACLNPLGWLEPQLHSSSDSWHPLHHAAIVAIEKSAARDKHLFPLNVDFSSKDHKVSSLVGSPLKRLKTNTNVKDEVNMNEHIDGFHCDATRPYLCTGYDIYFVWEPCIMCAMAVVHQRIKRVFFAFPNPNEGALGSKHRLQGEKSLNHHYAVFRVLLPELILKDDTDAALTVSPLM